MANYWDTMTAYHQLICEDFYAVGLKAGEDGCCYSCHNEMADGEYWGGNAICPPEKDKYGWVDAPEVIVCDGVRKPEDRDTWAKVLRVMRARIRK